MQERGRSSLCANVGELYTDSRLPQALIQGKHLRTPLVVVALCATLTAYTLSVPSKDL